MYTYLSETGVLNGTPEQIAYAKHQYRRQYKKQWKQTKRPRKELRIEFTLKQFTAINRKALESELSRTAYARNIILAATGSEQFIPHKEQLLQVLQLVSMASIGAIKRTHSLTDLTNLLTQAEMLLLHYIQNHTNHTSL